MSNYGVDVAKAQREYDNARAELRQRFKALRQACKCLAMTVKYDTKQLVAMEKLSAETRIAFGNMLTASRKIKEMSK
jgi:hypothetical protein